MISFYLNYLYFEKNYYDFHIYIFFNNKFDLKLLS